MWGALLSGLGGFGKAIGGGVAKVGKGIGSGIVKGGQKIGSEFKERIGEMREGGGSGAAPMTPGFNPGASMPKLGGNTVTVPHRGSGGYDTVFSDGSIASTMERRPAMPGAQDRAVEMLMGRNGGNNEPSRLPMPALDLKPPMPLTQMQQSGHPPLTGFDTSRGVMEGTPQRNAPPLTGMNTDTGRLEASRLPSPPMPSAAPPMIRDSVDITDRVPSGQVQAPNVSVQGGIGEKRIDPLMIPAMPNRGRDPIPYNQYDDARYRYVMDHLKENKDGSAGFSRNWKSILQNGLIGAANYADSGDWGKMLGGAVGGIGGATVNPQRGYEMAFDRGHGAHMQQAQGMRDQRSDAERKQRMGAMDEDYRRAQIDATKRDKLMPVAPGYGLWNAGKGEWEGGVKPEFRPSGQSANAKPRWVQGRLDGKAGWYNLDDPRYANKIIEPFEREKPMTMQDALAEEDVADNATVEQIANDSYQGRGGDNYLIGKMPPQYQQALRSAEPNLDSLPTEYRNALNAKPGTVDAELLTKAEQARNALIEKHNQMRIAAQNELQQMRQQEMNSILRDTKATRQSNAAKRRIGSGSIAPAANSGANGPTRSLKAMTEEYLNNSRK